MYQRSFQANWRQGMEVVIGLVSELTWRGVPLWLRHGVALEAGGLCGDVTGLFLRAPRSSKGTFRQAECVNQYAVIVDNLFRARFWVSLSSAF